MTQSDMSYEDFTKYYQMADELCVYLEDHMYALTYEQRNEKISKLTSQDLLNLLKFGQQYSIHCDSFWAFCVDVANSPDLLKKLKSDETIEAMTIL